MHLLMILVSLGLAWGVRLLMPFARQKSVNHWWRSLFLFLFPPLLLLTTAIAVLCMGYDGQMLGLPASWFSYVLASSFLLITLILGIKLTHQARESLREISGYPQQEINGKRARIINIILPYSAQIGLWNSELVVSQGLLKLLDPEHLQAVLAHEEAHRKAHDTFWFFALGWLRDLTAWLPNTEQLWQDLIFLRELRADQNASQEIDPLLLAESLLIVAQEMIQSVDFLSENSFCVAFHNAIPQSRLTERIDALLNENNPETSISLWEWSWLALSLLPLTTVPLHC